MTSHQRLPRNALIGPGICRTGFMPMRPPSTCYHAVMPMPAHTVGKPSSPFQFNTVIGFKKCKSGCIQHSTLHACLGGGTYEAYQQCRAVFLRECRCPRFCSNLPRKWAVARPFPLNFWRCLAQRWCSDMYAIDVLSYSRASGIDGPRRRWYGAVSYTHLTLPTICSV